MDNCNTEEGDNDKDGKEEELSEPKPKPRKPSSQFTKPDTFCRFSACMHLLGAISILVGCLLITTFTLIGIIFLAIGFFIFFVGISFALAAVIMILKRDRKDRYRRARNKSIGEYRSNNNATKLELVSNYFTPNQTPKAQTRSLSLPLSTKLSLEESTPSPSMETISTETSVHYFETTHTILTKPEPTIESPSSESTLRRSLLISILRKDGPIP